MERHIVYRVTLAVQVIDDFNDKTLSGAAIQVRIPGTSAKPIRKSDGYFVFTEDKSLVKQVEVESPLYHKALVDIDQEILERRPPILKVRLQPNRLYRTSGNVTFLEGKAAPGSVIQVIPETQSLLLRLLYDYEAGSKEGSGEIHLFQADKKDLSGRFMAISSKGPEASEVFHITEMKDQEQGVCLLATPLQKGYKKAGTALFPVYTTTADGQGAYFLYLPGVEGQEACNCQVRYAPPQIDGAAQGAGAAKGKTAKKAAAEKSVVLALTPSQGNRLDLEA